MQEDDSAELVVLFEELKNLFVRKQAVKGSRWRDVFDEKPSTNWFAKVFLDKLLVCSALYMLRNSFFVFGYLCYLLFKSDH